MTPSRLCGSLAIVLLVLCVSQSSSGSDQPRPPTPKSVSPVSCDALLRAMSARYDVKGMPPNKWIEVFASDYWPAPERIPFLIDGFELDREQCENQRFSRVQAARGAYVLRVRARSSPTARFFHLRVVLVSPPDGMSLFSSEVCLRTGTGGADALSWVGCDKSPLPDGGDPN